VALIAIVGLTGAQTEKGGAPGAAAHSKGFANSGAGSPVAERLECGGKRSATPL
jgi:hypothetical protein